MPDVGALFFDVFGTLVDWRTSIAREAEALLKPLGHSIDWLAFADAWRGEYQPAMAEVREAARRSASSMCCIAKISIALSRALRWKACRWPFSPISTSPGTGLMAGRIRPAGWRGSNANS